MAIKPLFQYKLHEMDNETNDVFIRCVYMELHPDQHSFELANEELQKNGIARLLMQRGEQCGLKLTTPVLLVLTHISKNYAMAVMYLFALYCIGRKTNNMSVSLTTLSEFFRSGFPTTSEACAAWNDQKNPKCVNSNELDDLTYWELAYNAYIAGD